ncbi:MAG TPA: MFS transporter [Methylomirabilota bacterium]|nr:MFS transporter [Methylomirabilota bacterium]
MPSRRSRSVLATAGAMHFVHDGFSEILYVLLPVWASEFGLSLWQVGFVRTAYTGGMAAFQIPAGILAERFGERRLLMLGTLVTACTFIAVAAAVDGFLPLLLLLTLGGLGSGVQHPLSSSVVAKAYEDGPRRAALGTYNFAGDIGKVSSAALIGLVAALAGWRVAATGYGAVGIAAAVILIVVLASLDAGSAPERVRVAAAGDVAPVGWGIRDPRGFQALSAIGMIDNSTRSGLLTFLPFVLVAKGLSVAGVGGALALVFAGGAMGKFVCGVVAERVGIIRTVVLTEAATSVAIIAILAVPLPVAMLLLVPLGIALNGTSSVLYATVADLVTAERRSRAYGLYYTLSIGASALGPTLYGFIGDAVGAPAALSVIAVVVLTTIPLCLLLRAAVAAPARG